MAAELLAWSQILVVPHPSIANSKKHSHIVSEFNTWARLGNADADFVEILNRYAKSRNEARYIAAGLALFYAAIVAIAIPGARSPRLTRRRKSENDAALERTDNN
jgi:hypothetical protein